MKNQKIKEETNRQTDRIRPVQKEEMFIRMNESRSHSADSGTASYSSTPRIGFENVRTPRDIRLGAVI
jgi:hypothetical protein